MPSPTTPPAADSALRVNLPAVPAGGARVAVSADKVALEFDEAEFQIVGKLRLKGWLERLEREGFRLTGRLGGGLQLECVRCLGEVELPLDEELDLVYLPETAAAPDAREGGESGLDADDMNVSFYEGDFLDLRSAVWEQIHLALPVKPLCSEACRGLCPACGADRNDQTDCGCDDARDASALPVGSLGALLRAG